MIARLLLPTLLAAALAPEALADKFHFGTEADAAKMTHGSPNVIVGVLVEEKDGNYIIRIEGGEMTVPKSAIYKIEKDGMTFDDLDRLNSAKSDALVAANNARREMQAVEASVQAIRRDAARAAEASLRTVVEPVAAAAIAPFGSGTYYDPVLHRAYDLGLGSYVQNIARNELGGLIRRRIQLEARQLRRELRTIR